MVLISLNLSSETHNNATDLRVALVHSFYRSDRPSGENIVVKQLSNDLNRIGIATKELFRFTPIEKFNLNHSLQSAIRVATGTGASPVKEIDDWKANVVHVHNLFPNYSSNWIRSVDARRVLTIHNFRSFCANGLLYREAGNCLDCVEKTSLSSMINKCYRSSRIATLPMYLSQIRDPRSSRFVNSFDDIIFLSERTKDIFNAYLDIQPNQHVIPNYIPHEISFINEKNRQDYFVVASNLSRNKGVLDLVLDWRSDFPSLYIFGDGEEFRKIADLNRKNVKMFGLRPREQVISALRQARGHIIPSKSYENFPLAYLDAVMTYTPVIALENSNAGMLIRENSNGVAIPSFKSIDVAINQLSFDWTRNNAQRLRFLSERYSAKEVLQKILKVYLGE